jgi:hypothetical protein
LRHTTDSSAREQRRDGFVVIVSMADLYAEEVKDLVVDFALPPATDAPPDGLFGAADITLTFYDTATNTRRSMTRVANVRRAAAVPEGQESHKELAVHRARLRAVARMHDAMLLADRGDTASARTTLVQARLQF